MAVCKSENSLVFSKFLYIIRNKVICMLRWNEHFDGAKNKWLILTKICKTLN